MHIGVTAMTVTLQYVENTLYNINAADRKNRLLCNIEVLKLLFRVCPSTDDVDLAIGPLVGQTHMA